MAGKTFIVTERDKAVLAEVVSFGVLTREQAMRLGFFQSRSRANERFKKLVQAGLLIARPHAVLNRGVRFVYLPGRTVGGNTARTLTSASPINVAHQLGLVDARIAFGSVTKTLRWQTDKELAPLRLGIVPDAFVEFEMDGRIVSAFLEYDRGTETRHRIEKKVRAYLDLALSGRFEQQMGRKFFRLLILTDSARRLASLSSMTAQITNKVVRFALLADLIEHGPHAAIWRRSGQFQLEPLTT